MRENSCCACKLAMETSVQLQDFKDSQNEQIRDILIQLQVMKERLYGQNNFKVRLEDLDEEEWDRLFNVIANTYVFEDPIANILLKLAKIKRGD